VHKSETIFSSEEIERAIRSRAPDDFLLFVGSLVLPSAEVLFDDAMREYEDRGIEPFQRRFFEDVSPSLQAVRINEMPPVRRFWLERTKKGSKDNDIAVCLLWLMAFARRPTFCQVVAGGKDQAGIIKHRAEDLLFFNPWLHEHVKFMQNRIVGTNGLGETVIEASDKALSHGETPAVLVLNELVHVAKWDVMETHYNNASGVARGIMIVATNSGYKGTKAEKWRQTAEKKKSRWHIHEWRKEAPWLNEEDLDDARDMNTPSEYERLFRGRWVVGGGDALTEESVEHVFCSYLTPMTGKEEGWEFVAGLDMGRSHDHSGVTVVGANREKKRIRVAFLRDWKPTIENDRGVKQIDVASVKKCIVAVYEQFRPVWFGYDPAEGAWQIAQELKIGGILMREMPFTSAGLNGMADAFLKAIVVLESFESEILRRDLSKFSMKARPPDRYRIVSLRDEFGHADVGTALLICLPKAVELVGGLERRVPTMFFHDESELTDEQVKEARQGDSFLDEMLKECEELDEENAWKRTKKVSSFVDLDLNDLF
jgi:hypothetical protein